MIIRTLIIMPKVGKQASLYLGTRLEAMIKDVLHIARPQLNMGTQSPVSVSLTAIQQRLMELRTATSNTRAITIVPNGASQTATNNYHSTVSFVTLIRRVVLYRRTVLRNLRMPMMFLVIALLPVQGKETTTVRRNGGHPFPCFTTQPYIVKLCSLALDSFAYQIARQGTPIFTQRC